MSYFYILAISWTSDREINIRSRSGIASVPAGHTQQQIYKLIRDETCKAYGAPAESTTTTFYYLAENQT